MQIIPLDHPELSLTGALGFDHSASGVTPRRLPDWTRPQVPAFMELMVTQPSGVRLEFATNATHIELAVQLTRIQMAGRSARQASFDLVCDGRLIQTRTSESGHVLRVDLRHPGKPEFRAGDKAVIGFTDLPAGDKQCQIWLPTGAQVELQSLCLTDDAAFGAYAARPHLNWVHYGSSISHCADAESPSRTWPAVAAQLAGLNLLNLGLGGNCQLDPFVARTVRDLSADAISLKLGINIVNMDSMRERTFTPAVHGFLDTLRERHADTPILVISPIYCPSAELRPGPTLPDADGRFVTFDGADELRSGCLTLTWIRKILKKIVAQRGEAGDQHLHYLDGLQLFGANDTADLPDDLHPNGAGYQRMGQRFHALACTGHGPFANLEPRS